MPSRRTAVIAVTAICACAGGPALASVAGHSTTATTTTTSSTTTAAPSPQLLVCLTSVRRLIAKRLRVRATSIHEHQFLATNGMPQCNYVIAHAHRGGPPGKVVLTANVDNGPQAHWRLMRKVVEAAQIFGPVPKGFRPPIGIHGLGANASWFPPLDQMMANNLRGRYLLTVGVIWHRTTQAQKIAVTRAVIVIYRNIHRLPPE